MQAFLAFLTLSFVFILPIYPLSSAFIGGFGLRSAP
jgi:nitrate reductase NapE component